MAHAVLCDSHALPRSAAQRSASLLRHVATGAFSTAVCATDTAGRYSSAGEEWSKRLMLLEAEREDLDRKLQAMDRHLAQARSPLPSHPIRQRAREGFSSRRSRSSAWVLRG